MAYTRELAINFWFEFDQTFLFNPPAEVRSTFPQAYPDGDLDSLVDIVRDTNRNNLAAVVANRSSGLLELARIQLMIMDKYFDNNDDLQLAFEDFGQGVLFDSVNPRPPTRRIHMMDGSPDSWVGYHRWHAFIRSAVGVGADAVRWDAIDRMVALAWAIQSEANPAIDDSSNPGLSIPRLDALRSGWMTMDIGALDLAFLSYRGHFAGSDFQGSRRAPQALLVMYHRVRNLLAEAAGNTRPNHGSTGRFWERPQEEFLSTMVYGQPLIADPGTDRGKRSPLVKVLRGELPRFPQMPLRRPPMEESEIEFIEKWIDLIDTLSEQPGNVALSRRNFSNLRLGQVLRNLPGGGVVDPVPDDIANLWITDLLPHLPGGGVVDPVPDEIVNLQLGEVLQNLPQWVADPPPDDIFKIRFEDLINNLPGGGVVDPSPWDIAHLAPADRDILRHRVSAEMIRLNSLRRMLSAFEAAAEESGTEVGNG